MLTRCQITKAGCGPISMLPVGEAHHVALGSIYASRLILRLANQKGFPGSRSPELELNISSASSSFLQPLSSAISPNAPYLRILLSVLASAWNPFSWVLPLCPASRSSLLRRYLFSRLNNLADYHPSSPCPKFRGKTPHHRGHRM